MTKHEPINTTEHTALHRELARRDRVARYLARQARIATIRPNMGRQPLIDELRGELGRARWAANAMTDRHHPLNRMLARHSGLRDFPALIESYERDHYRPTLEISNPEREAIADAFEAYTGEPAHRYTHRPVSSWTEQGTVTKAGDVRAAWFAIVSDDRLGGTTSERRTLGPFETEQVAMMQGAAAAARANRKHEQIMEIAEQQIDAELAGITLAEHRAELEAQAAEEAQQ